MADQRDKSGSAFRDHGLFIVLSLFSGDNRYRDLCRSDTGMSGPVSKESGPPFVVYINPEDSVQCSKKNRLCRGCDRGFLPEPDTVQKDSCPAVI